MAADSTKKQRKVRYLSKSGSWYSSDVSELKDQFDLWLSKTAPKLDITDIENSNVTKTSNDDNKNNESNSNSNENNANNLEIRAIICPHAGYSYCGATAAHSYNLINPKPNRIKTVFILGPDHYGIARDHDRSRQSRNGTNKNKIRCFISNADYWQTPFGKVKVNRKLIKNELLPTNMFELLTDKEDRQEHSLELIVPFLTYVLTNDKSSNNNNNNNNNNLESDNKNENDTINSFEIIPIIVANCESKLHSIYGKIFSNFLDPMYRNDCFFVISSDFCHWGSHYRYQPMPPNIIKNNKIMLDSDNESDLEMNNSGSNDKFQNIDFNKKCYGKHEIYKFIADMDHTGMKYISQLNYSQFHDYLNQTENTICGQNPICVLLKAVETVNANLKQNKKDNDLGACESEDEEMNENKMKSKRNVEFGMTFVDYSQSNQVKSKKEYSVSYAAGVLYSTKRD